MQSAGTKYASFLDDVVRSDVRETQKLIAELKDRGVSVHDLEDDEWHMLVHSYYSSIAAQLFKRCCDKICSYISRFFQFRVANRFGDLIPKIFDWQLA